MYLSSMLVGLAMSGYWKMKSMNIFSGCAVCVTNFRMFSLNTLYC